MLRNIFIIFILLYSFSLFSNTTSNLYNDGLKYLENGEYEKSIELFNQVIINDPNNKIVYDKIGFAFQKLKKFDKAKEFYEKYIILNNNEYQWDDTKFLEKGLYDKSISNLMKTLIVQKGNLDAMYVLASAYYLNEDYKESYKTFKEIINIYPNEYISRYVGLLIVSKYISDELYNNTKNYLNEIKLKYNKRSQENYILKFFLDEINIKMFKRYNIKEKNFYIAYKYLLNSDKKNTIKYFNLYLKTSTHNLMLDIAKGELKRLNSKQ